MMNIIQRHRIFHSQLVSVNDWWWSTMWQEDEELQNVWTVINNYEIRGGVMFDKYLRVSK